MFTRSLFDLKGANPASYIKLKSTSFNAQICDNILNKSNNNRGLNYFG